MWNELIYNWNYNQFFWSDIFVDAIIIMSLMLLIASILVMFSDSK